MAPKKDQGYRRQQFWQAIKQEKPDIVRLGLKHGNVALRTTGEEGYTCTQLAAMLGKERSLAAILETAHIMRESGVTCDLADDDGETPLMKAAAGGHLGCIKLLSKAGAKWHLKDEKGRTARDHAMRNKKMKVVEFFDRKGESSSEEEDDEEDVPDDGLTSTQRNRERKREMKEKAERLRAAAIAAQKGGADVSEEVSVTDIGEVDLSVDWSLQPRWSEIATALAEGRHDLTAVKIEDGSGNATVDPALWQCTKLSRLQLRLPEGKLTTVPDQLGVLNQMVTLILSKNSLTSLPRSLPLLANTLRVLDVSHNQLTGLPQGLPGLEVLDASHNKLTDIEPLEKNSTLISLTLDNNELQTLPLDFPNLHRMGTLSASHNKLYRVELGVGSLTSLVDLNLSHNQITSLPTELGDLTEKKVKRMELDPNPLKDHKAVKILQKGREPIKEILLHIRKINAKRGIVVEPPSSKEESDSEGSEIDMAALALGFGGSDSEGDDDAAAAPAPAPTGGKKKKKKGKR